MQDTLKQLSATKIELEMTSAQLRAHKERIGEQGLAIRTLKRACLATGNAEAVQVADWLVAVRDDVWCVVCGGSGCGCVMICMITIGLWSMMSGGGL